MQPWGLVAVMPWAAPHDRPVSWACQPRHWGTTTLKPRRLPSAATMSRRIDGVAVGLLWRALERRLRDGDQPALVAFVDGKPLPVDGNGKGPTPASAAGPAWVRGPGRVRTWAWAKPPTNAVRIRYG